MKAFVSRSGKGINSLSMEDVAAPARPGPGQIRVAMRAASLNFRDLLFLSGTFGPPGPDGFIPCSDGAGEIVETGADVRRVKVGDRVALTFNPDWIGGPFRLTSGGLGRGSMILPGVVREEIVVHESEAVLLPPHLSFEEGAALPCAGVTAWHSLCGPAPLMPGMTVLLQGGGGVSVLALQFAKLFGARVIITTSNAERCARLKSLGADEVIDYRADPEWHKTARKFTDGQGVDLTVDVAGADTVDRSLSATRTGGRVALVGLITGWPNTVSTLFSAGVDVTPIKVGSRDDFEAMNRAIAFHKLKPVIDSQYTFERLPDALHHLQSGKHLGKIVIGPIARC
jgi:NADPH:quinone reductase-like Zn-dependent oxidoreductase